jgi:hypothetical protein
MVHKDYGGNGSVAKKKKSLVVSLKGPGAKTNWLVVNHQSWSKCDSDSGSELVSHETEVWVMNRKLTVGVDS